MAKVQPTKSEWSPVNWRLMLDDPKKFATQAAWVIPLIAFAYYFAASRIWDVLPRILGDEMIYSNGARLEGPGENYLPNYLYFLTYSVTNICGDGFYQCAKALNVFWLVGLGVVIYLSARELAKPGVSLWIAAMVFFGPISMYVSFFTPESMAYFGSSLLIYFIIKLRSDSLWWHFGLVGLLGGVVALLKPHALFMVPATVLYFVYLAWKAEDRKVLRGLASVGAFLAGTVASKFAIGYLIDGEEGLTLFGHYSGAAAGALESAGDGSSTIPGVDPNAPNPVYQAAMTYGDLDTFLWQMLYHLVFTVIFYSLPLVIGFFLVWQALRTKLAPDTGERLAIFLFLAVGSLMAVSSLFVTLADAWGEVLSNRVMLRYYDYIFSFIPLLLLVKPKFEEKFPVLVRWLLPITLTAAIVAALPRMVAIVPPLFTDSSMIASMFQSGIPMWVFAVVGIIPVVTWMFNPRKARRQWLYAWWPLMVGLFLISSYYNMIQQSSIVGQYTTASRWTAQNIPDEDRKNMVIIGNNFKNVQQAQFWVDAIPTQPYEVPAGADVNLDELPETAKYVLLIGDINWVGAGEVVREDADFGYRLIRNQ